MAGLTADVDFTPVGLITLVSRIVCFYKVGGVTFGTHAVPVLVGPGPVKRVAGLDFLIGIKMKPALAALGFRAGVPGDAQALQTPAWKLDQVLLERVDTEGVLDFIIVRFTVRSRRSDEISAVPFEEPACVAKVTERCTAEITKHAPVVSRSHRPGMIRV